MTRGAYKRMAEKILPLAAMEHIMKAAGAHRVADDAKEALKNVLESKGLEISRKALGIAIHAGRKTIHDEDIKLAVK